MSDLPLKRAKLWMCKFSCLRWAWMKKTEEKMKDLLIEGDLKKFAFDCEHLCKT